MRRLIIGYGNPLRGDDAVGYLAAQRMQETNADIETEILAVHQLTPELVDPISRAAEVLFMDAAVGEIPGQIQRRAIGPSSATQPFSHYATPEGLLAAAQTLYGAAPRATLITVTVENTKLGETLSAPVRSALESLLLAEQPDRI
jgi:hydrogenase maturation protease